MNKQTSIILVVLLVIVSFLVGTAWTRVGFMGKKLVQASPTPVPQQEAQLPNQPAVLGAAAMSNLTKGGVVLGAKDAKVTVVEFSDPSCPYCAAAAGADIVVDKDETGKEIKIISDYLKKNDPAWEAPGPKLEELAKAGKIQLIFRYYPGHGTGEKAMQAAWCVEEQSSGKFWEFMNTAFKNKDKIETVDGVLSLVQQAGVDKNKVKSCLDSDKYQSRIQEDIQAAKEAASQLNDNQGFGTPTFFINGYQIVGAQPYKNFETIINQELAK